MPATSARREGAARHRLSGCRHASPVVAGSARCGCACRGPADLSPAPDSRACPPLLTGTIVRALRHQRDAQQSREPGLDGLAGRCVHPREIGRHGNPTLRPDLAPLGWVPSGLAPSLGTSRFLRRRHRYYGPVRLPISARMATPALPRRHPPPETNPADPIGSLMFRRLLSMRDPAFDPGEATPSRIATTHVLPSRLGTLSAFANFHISRLNPAPPHGPCLHFEPRVTATPARLGPGPPATALAR